ncbi:hypothetical protein A616_25450 [Brevibacillus brevis X23]|nr:hypothetical protein A616_25450 [Brevibacillus brevis X23]
MESNESKPLSCCSPNCCGREKPCHMFSSRLYPLFVRAVSFQTCDSAFGQLWMTSCCYGVL